MEVSNINCPNCTQSIQLEAVDYYCYNCLAQIRCKNCNAILKRNAKGCSVCGASLPNDGSSVAFQKNEFDYEQKGDSKKLSARFSDTIGESLVQSLAHLLGGHKLTVGSNPFLKPSGIQVSKGSLSLKGIQEAEVISEVDPDDLNSALSQIFKVENDKLFLINSRLKETGKRDKSIRIAILLLYASKIVNNQSISRTDLTDVLSNAKVYDNNFKTWLGKCDEITRIPPDALELSLPGVDAAKEILKEFTNPDIQKGSVKFSGITVHKKRKKVSNEEASITNSSTKGGAVKNGSPMNVLKNLVKDGFFAERKVISEVLKHLKDQKAITLDAGAAATTLGRLIKSGVLKREANADNQYTYYA